MKVINSKNTWYLIFGALFILILIIFVFNLIFKRTENKLKDTSNKDRDTLITQTETKSSGITYIKTSPSPSPNPTSEPSPTPLIGGEQKTVTGIVEIDKTTTKGGLPASKSGNLKLINQDGVVYLSTENSDGEEDTVTKKSSTGFTEEIIPPLGFAKDIGEYINRILKLVLMLSTLLVFGQLIIGGIGWITSGGDKGKVEEARNKIVNAVIGLIIVASSYAILQLALNFLGFQSINDITNLLQSN